MTKPERPDREPPMDEGELVENILELTRALKGNNAMPLFTWLVEYIDYLRLNLDWHEYQETVRMVQRHADEDTTEDSR